MLELDNMNGRYVAGTKPWTEVRAEVPVDEETARALLEQMQRDASESVRGRGRGRGKKHKPKDN
jgi:hypothetical protein